MRTRPAAQTAFGPMAHVAVERYERPDQRLIDDDLAVAFLPTALQRAVSATR